MNKNMVIILGGGLVISMLVALMVQAMFAPRQEAVTAEAPIAQILVADQALNIGDELSEHNMRWQDWPENGLFPGAIIRDGEQDVTDAVQGRLVRNIQPDEPIMKAALVAETEGNFLAAALKAGMRAMAIKVSAESSVGGFVTAGDYVDVILTYQVRVPSTDGAKDVAADIVSRNASQTVMEHVRVLAVDQDAKGKDGAKVGRTVTLEVDKKGTETLALASAMGELSLVLRSLGQVAEEDQAQEPDSLTTDVLISNVLKEITTKKPKEEQDYIRVYNGTQMTEQPIRARFIN